ncbi:hypothetical protein HYPSUDRAFT_53522 [Hypholoma sublateritium FD-334 SS-4]|uniref:Alpha-type protein kinase domain-containing protein n=1 Tax=Hypholoma sublateritium (strain FD-334 SS-4) TaxID=945553 RepID=A0A0D2P1F8_HYPSF|nr:hypothetical protein HYPSUDRAFT_53522 [Hypholoma sublateritium FD-334 SS-4]
MAEFTAGSNSVPCGGEDNEKNGCQEIFPRNTADMCQKCKKLNAVGVSEADIKNMENFIVCSQCGICGRNIANPCGTCRRKDAEESGVLDSSKKAAADERHARAQKSFGTNRPSAFIPPSQTQSFQAAQNAIGASTTPGALDTARSISLVSVWTINFHVRTDKAKNGMRDKALGSGSIPFVGDTTMPDVMYGIIQQINPLWTKREGHTLDLIMSECELRFQDNSNFSQESQTMTVKDFYHYYLNRPDRYHLTNTDKNVKMAKGTFIPLDIYIHDKRYLERIQQGLDMVTVIQGAGKRSGQQKDKSMAPLFLRLKWTGDLRLPGKNLKKNKPALVETEYPMAGEIGQRAMIIAGADRGRSKNVYKFTISDKPDQKYVAKSFIPAVIKDHSNSVLILKELVRIKRLQMFAELFQDEADIMAVEIAGNFEGGESDKLPKDYLVKPLRATTSVVKFSGTFGVSTKSDKLSATMTAFAHFIADNTACQLIFADIQGSFDFVPGETSTMVLFDPMTHSPFEATGLGDYGIKGIQDFVDKHECSLICGSLGLSEKVRLQKSLKVQSKKVKDAKEDGEFEREDEEYLTIEKPSTIPGGTSGADSDDGNNSDKEGGQKKSALVDY